MRLTDQVLNQAELLAPDMDESGRERLRLLCATSVGILKGKLRDGVTPEDIREEFVTAASLMAYNRWARTQEIQEFRAGDMTVKKGQTATVDEEALSLLAPHLKPCVVFLGV